VPWLKQKRRKKMNQKIVEAAHRGMRFVNRNSSKILTGTIIGGTVIFAFSLVDAVRKGDAALAEEEDIRYADAAAKADDISKRQHYDWDKAFEEYYEPLTNWDKLKIAGPYYIPPFLIGTTIVGCAIGNEVVNCKEKHRLAMVAETAQLGLRTYQEKVIEKIGEKEERKIQHDIHKDEVKSYLKDIPEEYLKRCGAENGESLFLDPKTGQVFVSTYEKVRRAAEACNRTLREENDIYIHALFIEDCGGRPNEYSYDHAISSSRPIDQDYFLDPHIEEYNGHEVTMVYMSYDTCDISHK
jgi:hypothetical protein